MAYRGDETDPVEIILAQRRLILAPDAQIGEREQGSCAREAALATCTGLSWFGVRLDPEVYYIDRLPVNVNGSDYAMVAVAALCICTLATIYPARAASKLSPLDGLRYE